jgi:hypothetical protein
MGEAELCVGFVASSWIGTPISVYVPPMPRKKAPQLTDSNSAATAPSASKSGVNKSAYVRSFPQTLKAKDLVEKGASEGIKLTLHQIYKIRSDAKRALRSGGGAKRSVGRPKSAPVSAPEPSTRPAPTSPAPRTPIKSGHALFVNTTLDIGLDQAEQLLRELRAQVHALYPLS